MIKVEMHGRLGNQMFQYAAARSLQEKLKQDLVFSFREVLNEDDKEGNNGWEDSLKYMNVKPYKTYNKKNLLFYHSSVSQIILTLLYYMSYKPLLVKEPYNFEVLYKCQVKWANLLNKVGVRWLKQGFFEYTEGYKGNYLLNGGFESKKYFDDIRQLLLEEFKPKSIDTESIKTIENLKQINSVCISIRHFVLRDENRNKLYNVCTKEYYQKALEYIRSNVYNPVFYICTNDLEWVKNEFDFKDDNVIYENNNNPVHIKLHIMSACRHFIISNSTFSWWAQYLGNASDKIVVSPQKWYNSDYKSELISNENLWIKF